MSEQPEGVPREPTGLRLSLAEQELVNSLGWMISLRWVAGAGVLACTWAATSIFRLRLPVVPLALIGVGILAYNAALWWCLRWLGRARADDAVAHQWFARLQITLDWTGMTLLIAHSGGIESPAIIFFLFHITIASLLLPHRRGYVYVTVAPTLVAGVAALEYAGVIPHVAITEPSHFRDPLFVVMAIAFFTVACYVMAWLCMAIARRLRRSENELSGLYESVRDVTSTLELPAVLERTVEDSARVLGCRAAAIRLVDPSGSHVEFAASWGLSDAYRGEVPAELARSVLDQETIARGAVVVDEIENDPRIWHPEAVRAEGIATMLSVALMGRGGPLGVLRAYGSVGHRFALHDAAYLQAVAAHAVVAIQNAKAYRLLAELDRDKSKFLRITTHELRSPVRVTESLLVTLADGYVGPLTDEQAGVVARALKRLKSLETLVDDLLDLAAGKANLLRIDRRMVDLGAVVSEVCERFRPRAIQKGIGLVLERSSEAPCGVWADAGDLERLVGNLVSNAVKYTERGEVRVGLDVAEDALVLEVTDTGIGIPEESIPHLFEEFYRAPNAKAVEEAGTGLGLSIIKDLVERHGGLITIDSREGAGTRVRVQFAPASIAAGLRAPSTVAG